MEYRWEWCAQCEVPMVVCPTCGNNCCNGGNGTLPDGKPCLDCDGAYDYQEAHFLDESVVRQFDTKILEAEERRQEAEMWEEREREEMRYRERECENAFWNDKLLNDTFGD